MASRSPSRLTLSSSVARPAARVQGAKSAKSLVFRPFIMAAMRPVSAAALAARVSVAA